MSAAIEYLPAVKIFYYSPLKMATAIWGFFHAAIVSHPDRAVTGRILRMQINSVFTFLTHAHSKGGNVSCISRVKKNL